ncbi:MAG: hypothetical protein ACM339_10460 [Ignavibacteria bacterium]
MVNGKCPAKRDAPLAQKMENGKWLQVQKVRKNRNRFIHHSILFGYPSFYPFSCLVIHIIICFYSS